MYGRSAMLDYRKGGRHSGEHEPPLAVQQFSVKYPTNEFIAAKGPRRKFADSRVLARANLLASGVAGGTSTKTVEVDPSRL